MRTIAVSGIMLTLLLMGILTLAFNIQPVKASGTIYIRADGSVDPPTAPIQRDGDIYTLTGNIYDSIVVERDNIVVDGAGYTLQGTGAVPSTGIDLTRRNNITIKNMKIDSFYVGILFSDSSHNGISGNNITTNYYGVYLDKSLYNGISGNNITTNYYGVYLYWSLGNSISGNDIRDNLDGVYLYYVSKKNSICGNNITANNWCGIGLNRFSDYNSISRNDIRDNLDGVYLYYFSRNNSICGNDITNNYYGVYLYRSRGNKFYHNNFIDNIQQVCIDVYPYPPGYYNFWDDGYPSGGNYWSDHVTVDDYYGVKQDEPGSDGIVDEPYFITGARVDNYPLVRPWTLRPTGRIQELIENIETWNLPIGTENSLTSKLDGAIHLLNQGNENGAIHKLMDFINQVEALREKKLTIEGANYLISEAQRIIDLING